VNFIKSLMTEAKARLILLRLRIQQGYRKKLSYRDYREISQKNQQE
jgi:hypothetical protein